MQGIEILLADLRNEPGVVFALAVLLLLYNYATDCVDVLREFAKFYRDVAKDWRASLTEGDLERFAEAKYIFELQTWLVGAIGTLIVLIFLASQHIGRSPLLHGDPSGQAAARGLLSAFGTCLTLVLLLRIKHDKRLCHKMMCDFSQSLAIGALAVQNSRIA